MQTNFSIQQLADPNLETANDILRKCVHCGFCTATCPTYVLLGDELDSPRGRIYQIKETLERGTPASGKLAKHLDRCLTCLSCTTTCPSGVDYMHLVDIGRAYVEKTHKRSWYDRLLRSVLCAVLPYPKAFRLSLLGAAMGRPFRRWMPKQIRAMLEAAPSSVPPPSDVDRPQVFAAKGERRMRVALMNGCAQQVLRTSINESTVRLLNRLGCEVVVAKGAGCCGALVHHLGREDAGHKAAKANIAAWEAAEQSGGAFDAVVINASGCGTTVKDYGFMLRSDGDWAERAARISALTKDVSEVLLSLGLKNVLDMPKPKVAYHSACSMQHGQKLKTQPMELLRTAGFEVTQPAESHLCCGSAGTYSIMQPDIAEQLQARKVANLQATDGEVVATGNIGCLAQITNGQTTKGMERNKALPVVHTVELLDWATGGPEPEGLNPLAKM